MLCLSTLPAFALADDVAAERARLANQRIQAEEERRAREEAERASQQQTEQEQAQPQRVEVATEVPASASRIEMSRALEQLRELGSLKDAGYLTDEEFQLLKQKILEGAL